MVVTQEIALDATGNYDIQKITSHVSQAVKASELTAGIVTVFCPDATGGVTTIEYECGLLADIQRMLDEIIPPNRDYLHGLRSGEDNDHSHLRATLVGPCLPSHSPMADSNFANRSRSNFSISTHAHVHVH